MHTAPPHPVAGHAQLSPSNIPYTPANTNRGSNDHLMAGQGYSLSPGGQPQNMNQGNRSIDMNNPRLNQSADHRSNRSLDQCGVHHSGQVNRSFDQRGQVNRSFDQQYPQVNRSVDHQNGAMSSRAASQTSLSRIPPGGMPNPALSADDSENSYIQEADLNNSRGGQRAVYTMNGFGEDTVV